MARGSRGTAATEQGGQQALGSQGCLRHLEKRNGMCLTGTPQAWAPGAWRGHTKLCCSPSAGASPEELSQNPWGYSHGLCFLCIPFCLRGVAEGDALHCFKTL